MSNDAQITISLYGYDDHGRLVFRANSVADLTVDIPTVDVDTWVDSSRREKLVYPDAKTRRLTATITPDDDGNFFDTWRHNP